MPGKILGIDINDDFVSAVQVSAGLKGFQVLSCRSVMIDKDKGPVVALKELSEKMDLKSDEYISSINGGSISYQNLTLPFKDPKKIKQTLPFEMEALVPFPLDDLVMDFNIVKSEEESEILAVSAKRSVISEHLDILNKSGISPAVIDIRPVPLALRLLSRVGTPENGLVIDIGLRKITILLFLERKIALIRSTHLNGETISATQDNPEAFSKERLDEISKVLRLCINNTLRSFSIQMKMETVPEKVFITGIGSQYNGIAEALSRQTGIAVEKVDMGKDNKIHMDAGTTAQWKPALMDNALSLAVREMKKGQGFNLRKGEFEVKESLLKSIKELKKAGIAVLIIIAFLIMDLGVDYYLLKKKYNAAEQRCADLFSQSFPDMNGVKNRLAVITGKIDELNNSITLLSGEAGGDQKMIDLLKDISQRIPADLDIDVTRMSIETGTATITGETDSFNTLTNVENGLKASDYYDVKIDKAEDDKTGQKVEFEIKLQRTK